MPIDPLGAFAVYRSDFPAFPLQPEPTASLAQTRGRFQLRGRGRPTAAAIGSLSVCRLWPLLYLKRQHPSTEMNIQAPKY